MTFNFRQFPLTWSEPKRSNKVMHICRSLYLPNGYTYGLVYYWGRIGSHISLIWEHFRWPEVTLKGQTKVKKVKQLKNLKLSKLSLWHLIKPYKVKPRSKRSKNRKLQNTQICSMTSVRAISSEPGSDPYLVRYRHSKLTKNGQKWKKSLFLCFKS